MTFGIGGEFSTFPRRLSPHFGWMLLDAAHYLLEPLISDIPDGAPITFLEFGGGDGDLGRDVMARLDELRETQPWADIYGRIRYRIVEPSAGLRRRQREKMARWIDEGRAEVIADSITSYRAEEPFFGLIFGNEVLDVLPCERLTISEDGLFRTHVAVRTRDGDVLSRGELDAWLPDAPAHPDVEERHVNLEDGWVRRDGTTGEPPPELLQHLERVEPLIEDLRRCELLPVRYYWSPGIAGTSETIARLLDGGGAVAMLIDYGGSARHALDPRSLGPHLRIYHPGEGKLRDDPYVHPGACDLTWDVDFTELGELVERQGLGFFLGHQNILESAAVDLWSDDIRPSVISRRAEEGYEAENIEIVAEQLVFKFREAPGFRAAIITPEGYVVNEARFGSSDAWTGRGLATIREDASFEEVHAAMEELGLEEIAPALGPCADVVSNLSDVRHYEFRDAVLDTFERHGLLSW